MTGPVDHLISPRFKASKASPGTFPDWVDIYEDRIWGWHLKQAEDLRTKGPDSKLAALHLAVAFIEPYEVYRSGESSDNRSKEFFLRGFRRIFSHSGPQVTQSHLDSVMQAIYKQVRCGLFHAGMTGTLVYLTTASNVFEVGIDQSTGKIVQIVLNPDLFVDAIISEFRTYVTMLRDHKHPDHSANRANFEKAWHLVHKRP